MPYLVLLVVAVVVVVLVVRASNAPGRVGRPRLARPPKPPRRSPGTSRPIAPDDDPEFLRELERRTRRDDGTKNA